VPPFGPIDAQFLIAGLAPGLKGANFSGRPFTGDYAGDTLYAALLKMGFAKGTYKERADDGLQLVNCRITNAVRCVPPQNKPEPEEVANCRDFLEEELAAMPNLKLILALGKISHDSLIRFAGEKLSAHPFMHGKVHRLANGLTIIDSYHCSRYNTQTKRLTDEMFEAVFVKIKELIAK
jgi:uracil-DNA glycosylase family 4